MAVALTDTVQLRMAALTDDMCCSYAAPLAASKQLAPLRTCSGINWSTLGGLLRPFERATAHCGHY